MDDYSSVAETKEVQLRQALHIIANSARNERLSIGEVAIAMEKMIEHIDSCYGTLQNTQFHDLIRHGPNKRDTVIDANGIKVELPYKVVKPIKYSDLFKGWGK